MKETNVEDNRRTNIIRETVTTIYEYAPPEPLHVHVSNGGYNGSSVDNNTEAIPTAEQVALNGGDEEDPKLLLKAIGQEKKLLEKQREALRIEAERLQMEQRALDEQVNKMKARANRKRSQAMKGNTYAASAAKRKKRKKKA